MEYLYNIILDEFYNKALGIVKIDDFYIIKDEEYFGVALENIFDIQIDEVFSNVKIRSQEIYSSDNTINLLMLTSGLFTHRKEFALFCTQFVEKGPNNEIRDSILKEPLEWWNKVSELIGNKMGKFAPSDIVAELTVLKRLADKSPKIEKIEWNGPEKSSIDITADNMYYEVKSSTLRYDNEITISSQFQLADSDFKVNLAFVKMEKLSGGETINSIISDLKQYSFVDIVEIEKKLEARGYRENSSNRNIPYLVHEIRIYEINDDFPRITPETIKDIKLHENIKKIKYTVDLNGIKYESL